MSYRKPKYGMIHVPEINSNDPYGIGHVPSPSTPSEQISIELTSETKVFIVGCDRDRTCVHHPGDVSRPESLSCRTLEDQYRKKFPLCNRDRNHFIPNFQGTTADVRTIKCHFLEEVTHLSILKLDDADENIEKLENQIEEKDCEISKLEKEVETKKLEIDRLEARLEKVQTEMEIYKRSQPAVTKEIFRAFLRCWRDKFDVSVASMIQEVNGGGIEPRRRRHRRRPQRGQAQQSQPSQQQPQQQGFQGQVQREQKRRHHSA